MPCAAFAICEPVYSTGFLMVCMADPLPVGSGSPVAGAPLGRRTIPLSPNQLTPLSGRCDHLISSARTEKKPGSAWRNRASEEKPYGVCSCKPLGAGIIACAAGVLAVEVDRKSVV